MTTKSATLSINLQDIVGLPQNEGKLTLQHVNDHIYVVKRTYTYDKVSKKTKETRKTLGQIVNNTFYTQEDYKKYRKRQKHQRNKIATSAAPSALLPPANSSKAKLRASATNSSSSSRKGKTNTNPNSNAPNLTIPSCYSNYAIEMKILDPRYTDGTFPLPQYSTPDSAGVDLRAMISEDLHLEPQQTTLIPTGIAIYIKNPYLCATILPRSGLGFKHGIVLGNLTGLIDADYQGQLMIPIWNRSNTGYTIKVGERIAQIVFVPIIRANFTIVKEFTATKRSNNGFGSTGSI